MTLRVEFRLTMPGVASWDGRWSGEGRNYTIVKELTAKKVAALFEGGVAKRSWFHHWSDGWAACVTARIVSGRQPKSDGFAGYDWMVRDILAHGEIAPVASEPLP